MVGHANLGEDGEILNDVSCRWEAERLNSCMGRNHKIGKLMVAEGLLNGTCKGDGREHTGSDDGRGNSLVKVG